MTHPHAIQEVHVFLSLVTKLFLNITGFVFHIVDFNGGQRVEGQGQFISISHLKTTSVYQSAVHIQIK